jgi:hypothetical protein
MPPRNGGNRLLKIVVELTRDGRRYADCKTDKETNLAGFTYSNVTFHV